LSRAGSTSHRVLSRSKVMTLIAKAPFPAYFLRRLERG
jgi:hypothetical protein